MNDKQIDFSAVLKSIRLESGMNRKVFSSRMGITESSLKNWENGLCSPAYYAKSDILMKAKNAAKIEPDEFLLFPGFYDSCSDGLKKILGEIDASVKGEREPVPYNVLIDVLSMVVPVSVETNILSLIAEKMGRDYHD